MGNHVLVETAALQRPVAQWPVQEQPEVPARPSGGELLGVWAQYIFSGRHAGLPELIEFLYKSYYFIPAQVPEELMALGETLEQLAPQCILEIGTGQGGTLFFFARIASRRAKIISIDLPDNRSGGYSLQRQWVYERFRRRGQQLRLLRGDSHLPWIMKHLKGLLGGQAVDFLFIDGDRRLAGVKQDFEVFGPLVRKGGMIAFHDIVEGRPETVGGVPEFWGQIKSRYRHSEIVNDPSQPGYGIGLLYID